MKLESIELLLVGVVIGILLGFLAHLSNSHDYQVLTEKQAQQDMRLDAIEMDNSQTDAN